MLRAERQRIAVGTFAIVLALTLSGDPRAAAQRALDLEQMVALSEEVVVGTVQSTETHWQGKLIVTVATVEVSEAVKGQPTAIVEITQLGGSAVHPYTGIPVTMTALTQVALDPGEEVLLFVDRTGTGLRQLVGAQQGKYVIREHPRSREKLIPIGPKRLVVVRDAGRTSVGTDVMTLDVMRERIRSIVERQFRALGGVR